jgi:protein-tyrosine phosphatase
VCTANVCRSPMAAAIFNALSEDRNLPFRAESAGTASLEGEPMAPNAVAALEEVGIYPEAHRARQLSAETLEEAELVLAMSPRHVATLRRLRENSFAQIHILPEYASGVMEGIPDPYRHTMAAYRSTLRQLYVHVERVVDRLGE